MFTHQNNLSGWEDLFKFGVSLYSQHQQRQDVKKQQKIIEARTAAIKRAQEEEARAMAEYETQRKLMIKVEARKPLLQKQFAGLPVMYWAAAGLALVGTAIMLMKKRRLI